jgi:hypothetical protein
VRRIRPAITLFLLAPLVAEFLLGDLPINLLPALLILAPMYGGGALLIREVARRARRGWPTILVLALAYAVFEEAFTTQTLFNPNYLGLHLHLLQPAYIPALGMGGWWTVFVLTLHTVWSISVSIALAEALVRDGATAPWLGWPGLAATSVLFALGAVASTLLTLRGDRFHASARQFGGAALVCVVLMVTAFGLPRTASARTAGWVPSPWLVGAGALAAGSGFLLIPQRCGDRPGFPRVAASWLGRPAPAGPGRRGGAGLCLACVPPDPGGRKQWNGRSRRQRSVCHRSAGSSGDGGAPNLWNRCPDRLGGRAIANSTLPSDACASLPCGLPAVSADRDRPSIGWPPSPCG